MKVALIAPINQLELSLFGDIHMALTQFVLTNEQYANFYANENKFKILDNGLYEGAQRDIFDVVRAAAIIKADEIILPDILYNGEATILSAKKSIEQLKELKLDKEYRLMAVVQGSNQREWWQCFNILNNMKEINTIGFSKLSCPKAFNQPITDARLIIAHTIKDKRLIKTDKEYHLLGGSHEILREIKEQASFIRSIDSSAPYEYAKQNIYLYNATEELKQKANIEQSVVNISLAHANIAAILETRRQTL